MSWNLLAYGSDAPSRARRLTVNAILAAALVAIYGLWTDFVPARVMHIAGTTLAIAATVATTLVLWRGYLTGAIPYGPTATTRVRRTIVLLAIPLFAFMITWTILVRSIPDLLTRWTTRSSSFAVELRRAHGIGRRACDLQVRGEYLGFMPGHICVTAATFEKLPEKGLMIIRGRTSVLGTHIVAVEPMPADEAPLPDG